jgi:hypothetical protein
MRYDKINIFRLLFPALFIFGILFTLLPALAQPINSNELLNSSDVGYAIGLANTDIRVTIAKIIRAAMGFIGIGMVVMIIYGGFSYMTAGGNDEKTGQGKKILIGGIIGLAIVLSAFGISNFVINQLVQATS